MFDVYSEPIEIVWRLHLSFYLSYYPIRVKNPSIGAISKWKLEIITLNKTIVQGRKSDALHIFRRKILAFIR